MRSRPKLTCLLLSLLLLLSGCAAGDAAGSPARITLPGQRQATAPLAPGTKPSWPPPDPIVPYDYTLCFAGDVSLAGGSAPASALAARGLEGCFSPELLEAMAGADVMCLNSEFAFTDRGEPLAGKTYTFRADPALVSTYQEMGVDLAVLANNHVFDFGEAGLQDTLDTFRAAGLPYVGAGENLDEASAVWYAELEGCTVAYVAGSRVEWAAQTRGATEERSGVFRTAESNELICQRIAEARQNADFVVVYEHWGTEGTVALEEYQTTSGRAFIDAGADLVVGDHPHVLQGIEWYNGKPIFYSMGNYWFSSSPRYTMLLQAELAKDQAGETSTVFRLVPAWTEGGRVTAITDPEERREFFDYMQSISEGVAIADDGAVTQVS